jgi:hypothetical protein
VSERSFVDRTTDLVLQSKSIALVRGFVGASASLMLCISSQLLPAGWQMWFQWPVYLLFLLCILVIASGVISGFFPKQEVVSPSA